RMLALPACATSARFGAPSVAAHLTGNRDMLAALRICGLCALIAALMAESPSSSLAADKLQYNGDIRPILAENCFACHGPDSAARKADLRLDKREVAVDMGAIAPGKPQE